MSGVSLGKVQTRNPHNAKGNRESRDLMMLNDAVLQANGGSWMDPPSDVMWSEEHYKELCAFVEGYKGLSVWGFKDPRSLFTLSGFQKCIDNLQFVGTFRNPHKVIASLLKRNPDLGTKDHLFDLWNKYNQRLLEVWHEENFPVVNFDKDDYSYLQDLHTVLQRLDVKESAIDKIRNRGFLCGMINILSNNQKESFFDPSLRSGLSSRAESLPIHVEKTYRELQNICL